MSRSIPASAVVVVVVVVAGVALAGPSPTAVADVTAALAKAQAALKARQWSDVVGALDKGLVAARNEAPLVVSQALVVDGRHTGLGLYHAITQVKGDALMFYVEVENLGARALPNGQQETSLEVIGTFSRTSDDGKAEVLGSKNLGTQTVQTWRTTGVHSLGLDVSLGKDAPAGGYVVDFEVRDLVGGKSARKSVAFTLVR